MSAHQSDRLRSFNHRLKNVAAERGVDVMRLRRQVAFQRLVARVASAGWVLKDGYCLEVRLQDRARATKDVDFVRAHHAASEDELLDELDELLGIDADGDGLQFDALKAERLRHAEAGAAAWRASVVVRMDGREFSRVSLDLVAQADEVAGAVEELLVEPPASGLGLSATRVKAVDVYQHAAEKFHAMARVYAGERPSSRVKDLVDLWLLLDAGLLNDRDALAARLVVVFRARDGAAPVPALPRPPGDWAAPFARMLAELEMPSLTVDEAFASVADLYLDARQRGETA